MDPTIWRLASLEGEVANLKEQNARLRKQLDDAQRWMEFLDRPLYELLKPVVDAQKEQSA